MNKRYALLLAAVVVLGAVGIIYTHTIEFKNEESRPVNVGSLPDEQTATSNDQGFESGTIPAPVITSISPQSGSVGTAIEVKGERFDGFEGDVEFIMEHPDGKWTAFYVGTAGNYFEGDEPNPTDTFARFKIVDQCPTGTTVGRYSGIESPCAHDTFPSGVYKIYTSPWSVKSNVVTFTITK